MKIVNNEVLTHIEALKENESINNVIKSFITNTIKELDDERKRCSNLDDYFLNNTKTLNKHRTLKDIANNKIVSNYARYITELNVGYFMSEPVLYNTENNTNVLNTITDLFKTNTIIEIDKGNCKKLSKYGKCYEINYINEQTELKTKSINPWNAVVYKDETIAENEIMAIYLIAVDKIKSTDKQKYLIYIYTKIKEIQIITDLENEWSFVVKNNNIGVIPIIEIKNNEEMIGDYENVTTLINAYNLVTSNDIDNVEEFIDSILILEGANMTQKQIKILRDTRAMNLPLGSKANYLTKVLDETGITSTLDRIRKDIHKFTFTPDMSDENFSGNSSGVALNYKILPFELNAKTKQAHYEKALRKRLMIYNKYLNIMQKLPIISLNEIQIKFNRGLPQNDIEMSNLIRNLQGLVSNKTLISQLSFIQDANKEIEAVEEEKQKQIDKQKAIYDIYNNQSFEETINEEKDREKARKE